MDSVQIVCDTLITKTCGNVAPAQPENMTILYILLGLVFLLFIIEMVWKSIDKKNGVKHCNKWIASSKILPQILGTLIQWRPKYYLTFVLLVVPISVGVSQIIASGSIIKCICLIGLNLIVWLTIKVCRRLVDIFSLRKQDTGITWCYISILMTMGLWFVSFLLIFNVKDDGKIAAAIGLIGTLLSWIFQDKIKGVVAFIHLRMHHLLSIGDWIKVPKLDVDGEVKKVTLTSVTIYNWDTTTSVIPICALHSDHFQNLQNMMDGKTYGRRMMMKFILDTSWFHPITDKEIELVKMHDGTKFIPVETMKDANGNFLTNTHLYRMYIYHWLMGDEHISQQPRLIVRWLEQKDGGMPLEIYAFIIDSSLAPFEWQQSRIVEHVIESMGWFGLRLYQSPSAYDVSNSNVYLTDKPATYREEDL